MRLTATILDTAEYRTFPSSQKGLLDITILESETSENTKNLISLEHKVHRFRDELFSAKFFYFYRNKEVENS